MSFALDTMANIKEYVKTMLNDPNGVFVSDDEIAQWWYEGLLIYADEFDFWIQEDNNTITTKDGVREYALPSDFLVPKSISIMHSSSVSPDTTATGSGTSVSWDTTPTIVLANNTLVDETFTLTLITDNGGAGDVWSVEGSKSGAQSSDYTQGSDYTTATVTSTGIGGGLKFDMAADADFDVGDIVQIAVDVDRDPLTRVTLQKLDAEYPSWRDSDGIPEYYYIAQDRLGLYPVPDDEYEITLYYIYYPGSDASDPQIPFQHRRMIVSYVLSQAYYKQHNTVRMREEESRFYALLDMAKHKTKKRRDRLPRIIDRRFRTRILPRG